MRALPGPIINLLPFPAARDATTFMCSPVCVQPLHAKTEAGAARAPSRLTGRPQRGVRHKVRRVPRQ